MQSSGAWDGGLTPDEFRVAAIALSDQWKQIDTGLPCWEWIPHVSYIQNEGYLSMEGVYRCNSSEILKPCIESLYSSTEEQGILEEEEPIDNATLILSDVGENRVYDFHIVYSFSYRVSVLYFRGYQSGGQPLNLDEIQKDLPCYSLTILRDSKWTFMTQEEHRYLHRPWYMLHPCGSCDWMKLLLGDLYHHRVLAGMAIGGWPGSWSCKICRSRTLLRLLWTVEHFYIQIVKTFSSYVLSYIFLFLWHLASTLEEHVSR